jgi:hypothetical protein
VPESAVPPANPARAWRAGLGIIALVLVGWSLLAAPRGFMSGDSGVKLIQAHDLWDSGMSSRALRKDPAFIAFGRVGGDFERRVGRRDQGIYSIVFVAPLAVLTGLFGAHALPILPLVGGLLALLGLSQLLAAWRVSREVALAALATSALATPLLFYSSQLFEHTLAAGLVTLALASQTRARDVLSGALVALAATIRPECYCAVAALGIAGMAIPGGRMRRAIGYLAGALAVLVPFWLFNHATAGAWDPLVVADHGNHQSAANALVLLWGEIPKAPLWAWLLPLSLPLGLGLAGRRGPAAIVVTAVVFAIAGWRAASLSHARVLDGLFAVTPLVGLGLLAGPRRPAWIFAVLYVAAVTLLDKSGTGGGLQLGARLLVPVVPVLVALAADVVDAHRTWLVRGSAALLVAVSLIVDLRGVHQATVIANASSQASARAAVAPGHMIVVKLDWQAGVLAPLLLSGKDVIISHRRDDAWIFQTLAARGEPGCAYISPIRVALPFAHTVDLSATSLHVMTVQAVAFTP